MHTFLEKTYKYNPNKTPFTPVYGPKIGILCVNTILIANYLQK